MDIQNRLLLTIRKCCLLVFGMVLLNVFGKAQVAARYDIVIAEMMAIHTQVGLPNNEWIELKNISAIAINLSGWRIGDASGQSGPMPSFVLQPDSVVIVCTGGAVAEDECIRPFDTGDQFSLARQYRRYMIFYEVRRTGSSIRYPILMPGTRMN